MTVGNVNPLPESTFTGASTEALMVFDWWANRMKATLSLPTPADQGKKDFKPKWPRILRRPEYKSDATADWWATFPQNLVCPAVSMIKPDRLRAAVNKWGCGIPRTLEALLKDLDHGADIGCTGQFRGSSVCGNAASAYDFGYQVTDAVADWVLKGFVFGPVERDC